MSSAEAIDGVVLRRLEAHPDERGSFAEIARASDYADPFVQSNHSRSRGGVLRGLHYHQYQDDLWYVISGRIQVVLADLRAREVGRLQTATVELTAEDPATLFIPRGVAHGFLALTDADLIYWVTQYYDSTDEHGIAWNDPNLAVKWQTEDPVLSPRDQANPPLDWELVPSFSAGSLRQP